MIIFGAQIIGECTLYAARAAGIPIECFVDDRIKGHIAGVEIISTSHLRDRYPQASFYLTSPNIADMIEPLKCLGYEDWHSCGELLRGFDPSGIAFESRNGSNLQSVFSPEHIKYLIRTVLHHHENYLHPERLTVQSVDLMITERCSMKCRDCSNLMQYYEHPENAELAPMLAWINALCSRMDEVYEWRVIGGEPFMHKELHTVVAHLCAIQNVRQVSIFTNATIMPREHQWSAFEHEKVRFYITEYDQSRQLAPLQVALNERGIAYVSERANGWTDCASLKKHDRTREQNEALFAECCAKNLPTLADGRLYRCPFAANAAKLKAVPDYRSDYLNVLEVGREDINSFLRDKRILETCDHCNGRSYGAAVIVPAVQTKQPLQYVKWQ